MITIKLPGSLEARLRHAVAHRRSTRSAVVREAIEAHLRASPPGRGRASCLDLAADLAGTLSGPSDLSSNRRRLRGYGR
jgi:Arc/MetJ-type ribon-helix-helix transcriptional regulator